MRVHHVNLHWRRVATACAVPAAALAVAVSPALARGTTSRASAEQSLATHAARAGVAAVPSTVFGGLTRQNFPVVFAVANNQKRLLSGVIAVKMSCTSGGVFGIPDSLGSLPIGTTGKVSTSRSIAPVPGPDVSITGGSRSFAATLHQAL
jgi:hypothetical protein